MEKFSSILSTIQAVLEDAEEKQLKDNAIKNWLRKLKDAVYKNSGCKVAELEGLNLGGDLHIEHLERVGNPMDAKAASLIRKQDLCKLTLSWGRDAEIETQVLRSLIRCKSSFQIPPLGQLPSLHYLVLRGMDHVLYIDHNFYGGDVANLSALQYLYVGDCHELESFTKEGLQGLGFLKRLQVHNLSKLNSLSKGLQCLTGLVTLTLGGCPELVALPDRVKHLNSLQYLTLSGQPTAIDASVDPIGCKFRRQIVLCHSLGEPIVIDHPKLQVLPENLQYVPALESLSISYHPELVSLPDWLGDITSLQSLHIFNCTKLTSFPWSIQRLTILQNLDIQQCPALSKRWGHTAEMINVLSALQKDRFMPRFYVAAATDNMSLQKARVLEDLLADTNGGKVVSAKFMQIYRSREVGQSYITSIGTTLIAIAHALWLMIKIRPKVILCNGPGTCIPLCVIAFLFKVVGIRWSSVFYVESIARVKRLSLSGLLLYKLCIADQFYVQWPQLQRKYPRAIYVGCLM
ncbi:hypothetical protein GH714_043111 [Hevea brasiliensis]|uniref:UDP-N-acetylglucosamine transferase subunit ALG14 n=1 Tax=Hevea brasiliensis TaxID=3981 RepID=A0A6A6K215_HEVBR|nr:hypothetical protein GH714_043111 [Hevea brasiliensis]